MRQATTGLRGPRSAVPADSPELKSLLDVLRGGREAGAVVLGGPGTGKSSLVRAALDLAELSDRVLTVQCSQSLREVPYGALVPLLTGLDDLDSPVAVLRALQLLDTSPVIVVVDVQYLDAASAFVLAQLVQNRAATLVAIGTGSLGRESGIAALADTGLLATVRMEPACPERVRRQCERAVGAPLTEGTVRTIHGMTGGNPRLTAAFLESAREQGVLVPAPDGPAMPGHPTPWILLRAAPEPDVRLVDTVESMHASLLPGERETLELLALAGPMPRARLRAVAGDHVPDLLEAGLVRGTGADRVELSAALHAEVLRTCVPPGRSADLYARWESAGGDDGQPPTARSVLWALECGREVPEEAVVGAGYRALGAKDWPTARALAPALAGSRDPRAALLVAELMLVSGRTWTARAELEELAARAPDPAYRIEAYSLLAMDRVRTGQAPHAWAALPPAVAGVRARGGADPGLPAPLAGLVELLGEEDVDDRREELLERARALVEDPATEDGTRAILLVLESDLLGLAGRSAEAIEAARRAYGLATSTPAFSARFGNYALVHLVLSHTTAGHLEEARRVLDEQERLAPRHWYQRSGTVLALRALVDSSHGGSTSTVARLRDAVVELRHHDPAQLLLLAEAALAPHRAALSPVPQDLRVEERARRAQQGSRGRWLLALALFSLAQDRTREYADDHQPLWRRILDDPRLEQDPVVRREILYTLLLLRAPQAEDDGVMARLHRTCAGMDGPRSEALVRVLDPALAEDPRGLAAAAEEMAVAGEVLPAAVAWSRLVLLHHAGGDLRRRGEALRHLKRLQVRSGLWFPPYVAGALALGELTAREQEIVDLAAAGLSNAEVAERLFVSQRTVEGHLYRVFTKLGISDRSELRDLPA
ncbi:hypothetical protein E7744_11010 [Citricoccus sp. SGAir0253]|uniref:LuxR C-terminal-related transcriptional regulator n=1 Tax=Citricoccus sp. SGAir0253 TaxID=2567881 RepID=UPI0010CCD7BD|nr:LuxR C-terminal-related transcriptional regulator [Citricoccus sp. SGAir0253]QCU78625.1 hypothetical protein E7744_11010 [Citricoccus sp. SGAir0253]